MEATVSSKGQITIPAEIRKSMGVEQQDKLVFAEVNPGLYVMMVKNKSFTEIRGILKTSVKKAVAVTDLSIDSEDLKGEFA